MSANDREQKKMQTPIGISMFKGEQVRLSRRWADARFDNIVYFTEHEKGGHFAAMEAPEAFVHDLRESFRSLR